MRTNKVPVSAAFLLACFVSGTPAHAAIITLSFTQFFDYTGLGINNHPSATWSGTFDPTTQPASPWSGSPIVNSDFTTDSISIITGPTLNWSGISITTLTPASFTSGLVTLLLVNAPNPDSLTLCAQPCQAVFPNGPDVINTSVPESIGTQVVFTATTTDTLGGVNVAAVAPEPGTLTLGMLGTLLLAGPLLKRARRNV